MIGKFRKKIRPSNDKNDHSLKQKNATKNIACSPLTKNNEVISKESKDKKDVVSINPKTNEICVMNSNKENDDSQHRNDDSNVHCINQNQFSFTKLINQVPGTIEVTNDKKLTDTNYKIFNDASKQIITPFDEEYRITFENSFVDNKRNNNSKCNYKDLTIRNKTNFKRRSIHSNKFYKNDSSLVAILGINEKRDSINPKGDRINTDYNGKSKVDVPLDFLKYNQLSIENQNSLSQPNYSPKDLEVKNSQDDIILGAPLRIEKSNNFSISKQFTLHDLLKRKKSYNYPLIISTRKFNGENLDKNISCFQVSYSKLHSLQYLKNLITSEIKSTLIMFIYIFIWFYLMIFIQQIYKQYGNNIIKICVVPLISMLIVKLFITVNLMLFIATIILCKWGDYFLYSKKVAFIKQTIFNALVPPLALHHYAALRFYLRLSED